MTADEQLPDGKERRERSERHFKYDFVREMLDQLPDDARQRLREATNDE